MDKFSARGHSGIYFPQALQPAGCTGTPEPEMAKWNGKKLPGQNWGAGDSLQNSVGLVPLEGWCRICTARKPRINPSGKVEWGIKTCLMVNTGQNEKLWGAGGKGERRLMFSRAAPRVCAGAAAPSTPERGCGNQMLRNSHGGGSKGLVSAHNYS